MMTRTDFDFEAWRAPALVQVEAALEDFIDARAPANLGVAMRYGVLGGGKRLRALLVLAACEAVNGEAQETVAVGADAALCPSAVAALRAACAVEMIHAYSLIHDDMPCMDNDVLRRGKPTVHVAFGEAQALLAGDALQALAFEILTPENASISGDVQSKLCRLLAIASGANGMAGGQAIDLASVGIAISERELRRMHELKTGALLQAAVDMGCASHPLASHNQCALQAGLSAYGAAIGLAFQVVDDILDVTADAAALGKTAGKDADANKPTYVALMGLAAAQNYADALLVQALTALDACGLKKDGALRALATELVQRQS